MLRLSLLDPRVRHANSHPHQHGHHLALLETHGRRPQRFYPNGGHHEQDRHRGFPPDGAQCLRSTDVRGELSPSSEEERLGNE